MTALDRARDLVGASDPHYALWTDRTFARSLGCSLSTARRVRAVLVTEGALELHDPARLGPSGNEAIYGPAHPA